LGVFCDIEYPYHQFGKFQSRQKAKKPGIALRFRVRINFGGVLLSYTAARAVPSAQKG
jgi:hypothetical protein